MLKLIQILIAGITSSMFLFPFSFKILPGINTKNILAIIGILIMGIHLAKGKKAEVQSNFIKLCTFASIISLVGLVSVTINNTPDYTYAKYIFSMLIWLSAAFTLCTLIRSIHGYLDVTLLTKYFVAISVFQCFFALIMDNYPNVMAFTNAHIEQGQDFIHDLKDKRLYGLGASLDSAGIRFSAVLIMLAYCMMSKQKQQTLFLDFFYSFSYIIIAIIGNFISRTTTVGFIISIGYIIYASDIWKLQLNRENLQATKVFFLIVLIGTFISIFLYNTNKEFAHDIRFGFEGFFSLAETGEWNVASNNKLKTMYVFPENIHTWIIGDGYFSNPNFSDPYYVGHTTKGGYYMGTDVGYLRFIFYFGLIGLIAFSAFIIKTGQLAARRLNCTPLIIMLVLLNFIVWFKVATDLFVILSLFLLIDPEEKDSEEIDTSEDAQKTLT